ncbi:MAG TPA: acetyl-CoA carboxylase biotin carboxyl carrier protein [Candidatus Acidoferrales bacterium]|nr:acetyl-CoA carboxylase biotin carboxyl carrier protein [Candidatus Acidoferrales bacterium]
MKGSKKQSSSPEISVPGVDLGQLERLLSFMSDHGLEEFEYAHGDLRIRLKKAIPQPSASAPVLALPVAQAVPPQAVAAPAAPSAPQAAAPAAPAAAPPAPAASDEHIIKSPIVGTFYAGPSPDAGPFVRAGDRVEAGQTVCIIEAMKLMNEIEADVAGEIARVLVENGQPVEYGEPLFAIRPTGKKK